MTKAIEVVDLVKKYKKAEKNAVDGISFGVEEGQFFALLGPNGAGKTTTISILTTTLSPTSGEVLVAGYDVEKDPAKVRARVGIIFQNPSLDMNLTAEENIRFHAVLYGMYRFAPSYKLMHVDYQNRVRLLAEVVGLEQEIFKPVKTFSGGMRRKLEIIRSLMHEPEVLFLDEPTVGLDPLSRKNLWDYLMSVRKREKLTIFLTTHYLDEAETVDQVCIINQGKVVFMDTPDNLRATLSAKRHIRLDSDDRARLLKELETSGVRFEIGEYVSVQYKNVDEAHKIIAGIATPLTVLDIHAPSLEEAYLEIIR
jgi:ABC-2 type transport system ATP-binding protein